VQLNAARAAASFYEGRYVDVLEPAAEAERDLREPASESSDAAYFYRFSVRSLRVGALSQLDWRRFRLELQEARHEADATENVHALLQLALNETLSDEIVGLSEASVARLDAQRALLPRERFTLLHILHMTAVMNAACATGKHAWGLECLASYWPLYLRSPLRRTAIVRAMVHNARARLLLNEHVRSRADSSSLREASKDAQALTAVATGNALRLRARLRYLEGDHSQALALFEQGKTVFARLGAEHDAQRQQYAIGRVIGGEQGERLAKAAQAALEQCGCHDGQHDARTHFPELAGPVRP
jgi:hypothetical protein